MENLDAILNTLLAVRPEHRHLRIPEDPAGKRTLMRSLMNVLPPYPFGAEFLERQNEELARQREEKGIIDLESLQPSLRDPRLRLWKGDITRLRADAIVNAANSQLLGCFVPMHGCIDNVIHSAAGVQLRAECDRIMREQGEEEAVGRAKITPGYNLPAAHVLHTVGPRITGARVTPEEEQVLASCYRSCLQLAEEHRLRSLAFCCISTGEFRFPNALAAKIAVDAVDTHFVQHGQTSLETVVFVVYKELDEDLYKGLLE
ncbi:MAG: protein-ADP-ribose hydrolase [Bacteroidales bacterium]